MNFLPGEVPRHSPFQTLATFPSPSLLSLTERNSTNPRFPKATKTCYQFSLLAISMLRWLLQCRWCSLLLSCNIVGLMAGCSQESTFTSPAHCWVWFNVLTCGGSHFLSSLPVCPSFLNFVFVGSFACKWQSSTTHLVMFCQLTMDFRNIYRFSFQMSFSWRGRDFWSCLWYFWPKGYGFEILQAFSGKYST